MIGGLSNVTPGIRNPKTASLGGVLFMYEIMTCYVLNYSCIRLLLCIYVLCICVLLDHLLSMIGGVPFLIKRLLGLRNLCLLGFPIGHGQVTAPGVI